MSYQNTSLIYEMIKDFGFSERQVNEVVKLADAGSGKYISNEKYRIIKHGRWFIIAPVAGISEITVIDENCRQVKFNGGELQLKKTDVTKVKLDTSPLVAQLDAKEIQWPLLLRKWKQGDYFYPLGMRKKKKLSRFFIDKKLSKTDKENVWILESNKRILWIVGHRIDDRCKVTDNTKQVLQINVSNL